MSDRRYLILIEVENFSDIEGLDSKVRKPGTQIFVTATKRFYYWNTEEQNFLPTQSNSGGGGLESITGPNINNSDPFNPIMEECDPVGSAATAEQNAKDYADRKYLNKYISKVGYCHIYCETVNTGDAARDRITNGNNLKDAILKANSLIPLIDTTINKIVILLPPGEYHSRSEPFEIISSPIEICGLSDDANDILLSVGSGVDVCINISALRFEFNLRLSNLSLAADPGNVESQIFKSAQGDSTYTLDLYNIVFKTPYICAWEDGTSNAGFHTWTIKIDRLFAEEAMWGFYNSASVTEICNCFVKNVRILNAPAGSVFSAIFSTLNSDPSLVICENLVIDNLEVGMFLPFPGGSEPIGIFKNLRIVNTTGNGAPFFQIDGGPGMLHGANTTIFDSYFKNIAISGFSQTTMYNTIIDQSDMVTISPGLTVLPGCRIERCKILTPLGVDSIESLGVGPCQILYTLTNRGITGAFLALPGINYNIDDASLI